jgi:hypothetical protein
MRYARPRPPPCAWRSTARELDLLERCQTRPKDLSNACYKPAPSIVLRARAANHRPHCYLWHHRVRRFDSRVTGRPRARRVAQQDLDGDEYLVVGAGVQDRARLPRIEIFDRDRPSSARELGLIHHLESVIREPGNAREGGAIAGRSVARSDAAHGEGDDRGDGERARPHDRNVCRSLRGLLARSVGENLGKSTERLIGGMCTGHV